MLQCVNVSDFREETPCPQDPTTYSDGREKINGVEGKSRLHMLQHLWNLKRWETALKSKIFLVKKPDKLVQDKGFYLRF